MTDAIVAMRRNGIGIENDGRYWAEENRKKLLEGFYNGTGISAMAQ